MLSGLRLLVLGTVLLPLLAAYELPSYASSAVQLNDKASGLAHYIMAICHDINGESAEAIDDYQQSVRFNGMESAPRLKLGAYYLRLDEIPQAIIQLKAVTRLDPQDAQAHYLLGLIYSSKHKLDLAGSEYEAMLQTRDFAGNPAKTLEQTYFLGELYYAEGKYPKAIQKFLEIVHKEPANTDALCLLGSAYADSGDHPRAINTFQRVLHIDPENSEALNALAYMYAEDNVHLDLALQMVHKALVIDPDNGAYNDSLGWVLYKQGQYAKALDVLKKAQSLIENEELYDHIGDVYKAMKNGPQAYNNWQKSLQMGPNQVTVQKKIKEYDQWTASQSLHPLN